MPFDSSWIFDVCAGIYAWMNDQSTWRASCAAMARCLPARRGDGRAFIADLGCGPGMSARALARVRPDARIIGLDLARRMLMEARQALADSGLDGHSVSLVRADAAQLPFATASLEAVSGHSFLYLLPRREPALREMRRALRPGGRVILMEPNAHRPALRAILAVTRDPRMLISIVLWRPFSRLHGQFTSASLSGTLQQAGFVDCHVDEVLGGLGLLAWAKQPDGD